MAAGPCPVGRAPQRPPRRRDPEGRRRRWRARLRVHAQRVLGELPILSGLDRDLVLRGLGDPDPLVQRCAAEALGRHPDPAFIGPLLQLRQASAADDTHLVHVVRMALRDQFQTDAGWVALDAEPRSDRDLRDVADVATGVPSAAAARFLLARAPS